MQQRVLMILLTITSIMFNHKLFIYSQFIMESTKQLSDLLFMYTLFLLVPFSYFYVRAFVVSIICIYFYGFFTVLLSYVPENLYFIVYISDIFIFISLLALFINYSINYYFDYTTVNKSCKLESFDRDINFIYIVLKKPIRLIPTMLSMFGDPYSSISILVGNDWYCFRKIPGDKKGLRKSNYKVLLKRASNKHQRFIIHKLCINTENRRLILDNIVKNNKPYDLLKNNCVIVFKPLFSAIGINLKSWFDKLPSIAILRLKNKFIYDYNI